MLSTEGLHTRFSEIISSSFRIDVKKLYENFTMRICTTLWPNPCFYATLSYFIEDTSLLFGRTIIGNFFLVITQWLAMLHWIGYWNKHTKFHLNMRDNLVMTLKVRRVYYYNVSSIKQERVKSETITTTSFCVIMKTHSLEIGVRP